MAGKYYWLKLNRDFFKRHDIRILEQENKDYALFYLKLLTESIDHEGKLRFSDLIPYDDSMLSTITNTPIDTVRVAIETFLRMNLIEVLDDGTIYMNKIQEMIGTESEWAKKKREYRIKQEEEKRTNEAPVISDARMEWAMKSQEFWEKTFEEYPKKVAEDKARYEWENIVQDIQDLEQRIEYTRIIYKAVRLYVADYKINSPDDTSFKFVPRFDNWLKDHLSVWEKRVREAN